MFTMQAESHADLIILRFTGDLCLRDAAGVTKKLETFLFAKGVKAVVLDLSKAENVDPSGLSALINVNAKGLRLGRGVALLSPSPAVMALMRQIEVDRFFPIFHNEAEMKGYLLRMEDMNDLMP